jgi:predicted phosphodiesterase
MKVRVLSDLHLENCRITLRPTGENIVVLAGDIAVSTDAVAAARRIARECNAAALLVAGNHEFYRDRCHPTHTWGSTLDDLRRAADYVDLVKPGKVTFLENSSVEYNGVRFLGATLWTDMKTFGDDPFVKLMIEHQFPDYDAIYLDGDLNLTIEHVLERHQESVRFISDQLAKPFIAERYRADKMSAAFASRLDGLILKYSPRLWIHGHTHTSHNYEIGRTQIVCNPRGYRHFDANPCFDPKLVINIG